MMPATTIENRAGTGKEDVEGDRKGAPTLSLEPLVGVTLHISRAPLEGGAFGPRGLGFPVSFGYLLPDGGRRALFSRERLHLDAWLMAGVYLQSKSALDIAPGGYVRTGCVPTWCTLMILSSTPFLVLAEAFARCSIPFGNGPGSRIPPRSPMHGTPPLAHVHQFSTQTLVVICAFLAPGLASVPYALTKPGTVERA